MIIFIYGPDAYRAQQYAAGLITRYRAKYQSGMNLISIDMEQENGMNLLHESLKSSSFFDEVKLLVIRNAFSTKETAAGIADACVQFNVPSQKETVIMICEPRQEKELKVHRELFTVCSRKGNTVHYCEYLSGAALSRWISDHAQELTSTFTAPAVHQLIARRGNDTWALHHEMIKLANYAGPRAVTDADVALLVPAQEDLNIFTLTDAFASRNAARTCSILYQELQSGRDPYYVMTMMNYQVRTMVSVKDCLNRNISQSAIAQYVGIHPFVARKTAGQVSRYTLDELKHIFSVLVDIEHRTKQGKGNLIDDLYLVALSAS